ncbi:hypothetical protein D0469_06330 [Peribacillus saganii]|uniref:Uncharacterized protein n=1 Tax=Peribacillus saganii TaxID=2303992 RepID=A0A372LQQ8_9BACI|nr:hypothetical protein [Peribacillus saganii]RFU70545.1 hypothetical protein D0469_06330 [Peribacillus saganii]
MSEIIFLASSKPFKIPDEIEEYNNRKVFEREEEAIFFSVQEVEDYFKRKIEGLFLLPYIYIKEMELKIVYFLYLLVSWNSINIIWLFDKVAWLSSS